MSIRTSVRQDGVLEVFHHLFSFLCDLRVSVANKLRSISLCPFGLRCGKMERWPTCANLHKCFGRQAEASVGKILDVGWNFIIYSLNLIISRIKNAVSFITRPQA